MSQKYEKKENPSTGREYVDDAIALANITTFNCMHLPRDWAYAILNPLIDSANKIENLVVTANKIYINEQNRTPEQSISAYQERVGMLYNALREIGEFEVRFDRLTSYISIEQAERKRLRRIVMEIIGEARQKDPDLKTLEIKVVSRTKDMMYTSAFGEARTQLRFNSRMKDRWIAACAKAKSSILGRIERDNKAISRLKSEGVK